MRTFVFVTHPITEQQFKKFWPEAKFLPVKLIQAMRGDSFKIIPVKAFYSLQNKEAQGFLLVSAFLPKELAHKQDAQLLRLLADANKISQKLGADIMGLGGYFAMLADRNADAVMKALEAPVTSGRAFAAWSIIEGIYRTAKIKRMPLANTTVVIIGACSALGSLCARKIAEYVSRVVLFDADESKLLKLKDNFGHSQGARIAVEPNMQSAALVADILIIASAQAQVIPLNTVKPGAIVCDISASCNPAVRQHLRDDITLIESGLIKVPHAEDFKVNTGLPQGVVCASLAELMILTLEGKFVHYSLGEEIELYKAEDIADIAVGHGFEVWLPEAPVL